MHHHFLLVTSVKNLKTDCALTTKKKEKKPKRQPQIFIFFGSTSPSRITGLKLNFTGFFLPCLFT